MLKITTANGVLVISPETKLPLTITNPMVNDRGSGSLPFSVPDCEHNQMVMGYPNRVTRSAQPIITLAAVVETDIKTYTGTVKYVNTSGGSIELAFYTQEGAFWEWAKKTKLRNISVPESIVDFDFQAVKEDYFYQIWPDVNMAFFPIATNFLGDDETINKTTSYNPWCYSKLCISNYNVLNNPADLYNDGSIRNTYLSGFIYTNEVIQWIANTLGFTVNDCCLASTEELRRAVVLNNYNTVNYLQPNDVINYAMMLPNVTVYDFIRSLETTFGCIFFADMTKKQLTAKFTKDIFNLSYTENLNASIKLNDTTLAKGLKIKFNRGNSDYIAVNENIIDNGYFTFTTEATTRIHGYVYITTATPNRILHPDKFVFCTATQAYFRLYWVENTNAEESDGWDYKCECIHSNYYDIDNNSEIDQVTIEADKNMLIPNVPVSFRQFYKNALDQNAWFDFVLNIPHFDAWNTIFNFDEGFLVLADDKTPIAFAFNRAFEFITFPVFLFGRSVVEVPVGSVDKFDKAGDVYSGATLGFRTVGAGGVYETWYKELEQFYLKSGKELSVSNFKLSDVLTKDIFAVFQNQESVNFIFKEIKFTASMNGTQLDSAVGLTVKPYL
jgi:hypothetical protein